MGLPEFPQLPEPRSREDLIRLLFESIVMEELSLAAIVNAEAEKVQALTKHGICGPVLADEALKINQSVKEVIQAAGEKEKLLLRKLKILSLLDTEDDIYSKYYEMHDN